MPPSPDPFSEKALFRFHVVSQVRARVLAGEELGTAVADAFGRDFTGKYMDEVFEKHQESLSHSMRVQVVETGLPCLRPVVPGTFSGMDIAPQEGIHLPLATDGAIVDNVLSMFVYVPGTTDDANGVWHLANR